MAGLGKWVGGCFLFYWCVGWLGSSLLLFLLAVSVVAVRQAVGESAWERRRRGVALSVVARDAGVPVSVLRRRLSEQARALGAADEVSERRALVSGMLEEILSECWRGSEGARLDKDRAAFLDVATKAVGLLVRLEGGAALRGPLPGSSSGRGAEGVVGSLDGVEVLVRLGGRDALRTRLDAGVVDVVARG